MAEFVGEWDMYEKVYDFDDGRDEGYESLTEYEKGPCHGEDWDAKKGEICTFCRRLFSEPAKFSK